MVNEEGKLKGLPFNRWAQLLFDPWGRRPDCIVGTVLYSTAAEVK